jgi:hypothetical protein
VERTVLCDVPRECHVTINEYLGSDLVLWIDTESTGDAIHQVSLLVEQHGCPIDSCVVYSQPTPWTQLSSEALALLGVSQREIWRLPSPCDAHQTLQTFLHQYSHACCLCAGHSVAYDVERLLTFDTDVKRLYFESDDPCTSLSSYVSLSEYMSVDRIFCTHSFSKRLRRQGKIPPGPSSLCALSSLFSLQEYAHHDAFCDMIAARDVAYCLLSYV